MKYRHNLGEASAPWGRDISRRIDELLRRDRSVRQKAISAQLSGPSVGWGVRTETEQLSFEVFAEAVNGSAEFDIAPPDWANRVACVSAYFTRIDDGLFSVVGRVDTYFDNLDFTGYDPFANYSWAGSLWGSGPGEYVTSPVAWTSTRVRLRTVWEALQPEGSIVVHLLVVWSA